LYSFEKCAGCIMSSKARTPKCPQAQTPRPAVAGRSVARRRLLLVLLALGIASGTWALFEFVVWNRLPAELVGKWVVQGGEQDGATFDFHRNGTMVGRINVRGNEGIINAQAAVEGDALLITTQNPTTKRGETKKQTIKTLNATDLVLQDEQKNVFRMERASD
jgi:uncharacterized protein (TIGR03066 family)